mmetsp:Transcript_53478/g.106453  ORF Transcript_53478/g.106453 Transcript_53478/m.106453 type:complete len:239 (-) Transcript_53478:207-923(-)|eukprot:CAMPEP_0172661572 /NCGR_PEP_ID=MMETSP1074-20121228/4795_1 /TAXON_ID=2916 /ORGANISM="Ceratium fusus, Strain PA161109" /LENGTH=238 /DNA_ID=CAMNT_0013477363 /DNA_START=33 /DNA_END=749 /DNA_ORIENTATION=+
MGQGLDVLKTCDGLAASEPKGRNGNNEGPSPRRPDNAWDEDALVTCAAIEDGVKSAVACANRGGARISNEVLLNHELLQHARQGNIKGLSTALDKGAWTETRRPLVMKPQKPDVNSGANGPDGKSNDETAARASGTSPHDIGMTALMFSSQNGSVECVRRLLWAGADVNAVEEDAWSALHFSAKEGHLEVCTTLLANRADHTAHNADDKTPLQIAEEEDEAFAEKLKKALQKGVAGKA